MTSPMSVCVAEARVSVTSVFLWCYFYYTQHNITFCDVSIFVDVVIHEMNELPELLNSFNCKSINCFYFAKCPPLTLRNAKDSNMLLDL